MLSNGLLRQFIIFGVLGIVVQPVPLAQEAARIEPLSIVTDKSATLFAAEIADNEELRRSRA